MQDTEPQSDRSCRQRHDTRQCAPGMTNSRDTRTEAWPNEQVAWRALAPAMAPDEAPEAGPLEALDADALYDLWGRCAFGTTLGPDHAASDAADAGLRNITRRFYEDVVAPHFAPGASNSISLVIPAWRERHRIERSIALVARFLRDFPLDMQVTYVIETSDDGTLEIATAAAAAHDRITVHDNRVQRGKGYAVRSGMHMADGDIVLYNDTDLAVPLHQLLVTLAEFAGDPKLDIVIGARRRLSERSLVRRAMTRAYRFAVSGLAGLPAGWDPQCGFKAFRRAAANRLFERLSIDGFAFDVELLLIARRLGLKVRSLPVPWLNDERSTVRPVLDVVAMARELAGLRLNRAPRASVRTDDATTRLLIPPPIGPRSGGP